MHDQLLAIAAAFGTTPTISGAGEQQIFAKAFEAWEDTTIEEFRDSDGTIVIIGWELVPIPKDKIIIFPQNIKSFVVSTGGRGQVYNYKSLASYL